MCFSFYSHLVDDQTVSHQEGNTCWPEFPVLISSWDFEVNEVVSFFFFLSLLFWFGLVSPLAFQWFWSNLEEFPLIHIERCVCVCVIWSPGTCYFCSDLWSHSPSVFQPGCWWTQQQTIMGHHLSIGHGLGEFPCYSSLTAASQSFCRCPNFQIRVQLIKRMMESGFEPRPSGCIWNHGTTVSERILYGNSFLLRWELLVMCEVSRILNKETNHRPFDICLTSCTPVAEPTSPKILHNSEKYSLSLSEGPHASFLGSIWATHFEM